MFEFLLPGHNLPCLIWIQYQPYAQTWTIDSKMAFALQAIANESPFTSASAGLSIMKNYGCCSPNEQEEHRVGSAIWRDFWTAIISNSSEILTRASTALSIIGMNMNSKEVFILIFVADAKKVPSICSFQLSISSFSCSNIWFKYLVT